MKAGDELNLEINKENFKQALFEYFSDNYEKRAGELIRELADEFPYSNDGLDPDLSTKNFADWLMIEMPLPDTGKTVVEEFIEKNPNLPEELKNGMSRMKNIIRGGFRVLSYSAGIVKLEKKDNSAKYSVKLYHTTDPTILRVGTEINGRIHEFDEYYRFAGIFSTKVPKSNFLFPDMDVLLDLFEKDRLDKIQNSILSSGAEITALLKNYPSAWINAICKLYNISSRKKYEKINMISHKLSTNLPEIMGSLSSDSKEVLRKTLNKEGVIKYSQLKEFDDDIHYFWTECPKSPIGALIARCRRRQREWRARNKSQKFYRPNLSP